MRYSNQSAASALLLLLFSATWLGCDDGALAPTPAPEESPEPGIVNDVGFLRIRVVSDGLPRSQTGYLLFVDGRGYSIGPHGQLSLTVSPGEHSVQLVDLESGCTVQGANPRLVVVGGGGASIETFEVDCPRGVLE